MGELRVRGSKRRREVSSEDDSHQRNIASGGSSGGLGGRVREFSRLTYTSSRFGI
jgi:hypothetical protein